MDLPLAYSALESPERPDPITAMRVLCASYVRDAHTMTRWLIGGV
jgi:hypothetical protein